MTPLWSSLTEACYAREWVTMVLFPERSGKKKVFPISVQVPTLSASPDHSLWAGAPKTEEVIIPSLLTDEGQFKFQAVYYTHCLTAEALSRYMSPAVAHFSAFNANAGITFLNRTRSKGKMVPYESVRRMFYRNSFTEVQQSETLLLRRLKYRRKTRYR